MLSTTLKINGFSHIASGSWNIHWDNIADEAGVEPIVAAHIKENTKKQVIEYEVLLPVPGDYYEFTVDAVNEGTYDGEITKIVSTVNDEEIVEGTLPEYIKYSVKYADGTEVKLGDVLKKRTESGPTTKKYKVRIEYDKEKVTNDIVNNMESAETYVFTYEVTYSQKTRVSKDSSDSDLDDDTWDEIVTKAGGPSQQPEVIDGQCGPYHIGDTKEIRMDLDDDGVNEPYTVRLANCSTPSICETEGFSQTACGLVFEFTGIIGERNMNPVYNYGQTDGDGSYGGWAKSDMRAYLNNGVYGAVYSPYNDLYVDRIDYSTTGFLNKLPRDLVNNLADTYTVSGHGSAEQENNTSTDKVYLLALHELWEKDSSMDGSFIDHDTAYDQTRQLDYYKENGYIYTYSNHTDVLKKPPYIQNDSLYWWLRSAPDDYRGSFYLVTSGGSAHFLSCEAGRGNDGISPAFRLKEE